MTDNEIIKALECCIKSNHFGDCFENKCPCVSENGCELFAETLYPYALDLINRLQLENKKNENIIRLADKTIETANAEIEKLKEELDSSQERYFGISNLAHKYRNKVKTAKAEAYKECIGKVKKEILPTLPFNFGATGRAFDNLLKELVGDNNA